jgi:hypothetical protein
MTRSASSTRGERHRVPGRSPRPGRPALRYVTAPTRLIVGGADVTVLQRNHRALAELASETKELATVPGASHLFEEPGALDRVADLAPRWVTPLSPCDAIVRAIGRPPGQAVGSGGGFDEPASGPPTSHPSRARASSSGSGRPMPNPWAKSTPS